MAYPKSRLSSCPPPPFLTHSPGSCINSHLKLQRKTYMFVLGNLLMTLAKISDILLTIYLYIIIGRAIISWVNPDPYNPIVNFLYRATEPVLAKVRNKLPYM